MSAGSMLGVFLGRGASAAGTITAVDARHRELTVFLDADFDKVNIDMMSGLAGASWDSLKRDVETLLTWSPPCVSIYLPMLRAQPPADANPRLFRDLLRQAETELSRRYKTTQVQEMVRRVHDAIGHEDAFWTGDRDAVAIFVSRDFSKVIDLQQRVDPYVEVGGKPVTEWDQMRGLIAASPGKPVDIGVERDGQVVHLTVTPASVANGEGRIGVESIHTTRPANSSPSAPKMAWTLARTASIRACISAAFA